MDINQNNATNSRLVFYSTNRVFHSTSRQLAIFREKHYTIEATDKNNGLHAWDEINIRG